MNRLYVVESSMTSTGAVSDHRFPLRPSEIESFARAVAASLGIRAGGRAVGAVQAKWRNCRSAARDLQKHRGRSLVIAGDTQPPAVHALAHVMNQALGNAGATVVYAAPVEGTRSIKCNRSANWRAIWTPVRSICW